MVTFRLQSEASRRVNIALALHLGLDPAVTTDITIESHGSEYAVARWQGQKPIEVDVVKKILEEAQTGGS